MFLRKAAWGGVGWGREEVIKVRATEGSWGSPAHDGERRWSGRGQETRAGARCGKVQ